MGRKLKIKGNRLKERHLLAVDLFSGCGGLSLGLKKAFFNIVAAVEFEHLAAEIYEKNHPEVLLFETNIRTLSPSFLRSAVGLRKGELDLLAGCPPCQGFSTLSRKNKAKAVLDPRNELIFQMLRFTRALRPKAILMENVPGLQNHWRFPLLLKGLRRLGYQYKYGVLDAAKFGVPQRRKRLILMASKMRKMALPHGKIKPKTVRDIIEKLPHSIVSSDNLHKFRAQHSKKIRNIIRKIPKDGGSRTALGKKAQLKCHVRVDGFKDVYGRMKWDKVSPTITGSCFNPSKGRFLHPSKNRAISLREASLLQSFPPNYKFIPDGRPSKSGIALLIGNALPPELARRQAEHLKQYIDI
jgi:DNA (cytosine-5)-methyltransferase 1